MRDEGKVHSNGVGVCRRPLKERISSGEVLTGAFASLGCALTTEILAVAGFDWLVIDLEHGAGGEREALGQIQALAHTGAAALVRVESLERLRIGRALDLGAEGILVPRLESADEARRAVDYCRYFGARGVARQNRAWHWTLDQRPLSEVDAEIVCAVQVETEAALREVEAIAAVDGVDILFVGPGDLGHALGISGGPDTPELQARAAEVVNAARAHGKTAGILLSSTTQVSAYLDLGFTFVGCSADSGLLAQEARRVAEALKDLVGASGAAQIA